MIYPAFRYPFFLLVFFCLLPFAGFGQDEERCKQLPDIAELERQSFERKAAGLMQKRTAAEAIDIIYYGCNWYVNPEVRAISGTVTVYYKYLTDAASISLDMADALVIDSLRYHGRPVAFERGDNTLKILLGAAFPKGSLDSVAISYHGVPPNTGLGSFNQAFRGVTRPIPVIWTLSEPYGARDWWPCKNGLGDKADSLDVVISCPVAYKGVSNGLNLSEQLSADGKTRTLHWKHRYPITSYLVCLAVTNYVRFDRTVLLGTTELPMETFCYPESRNDFETQTQSTLNALQLFHRLLGDYPFIREKYGHTQFSWGGGEEHQTNSFVVNAGASLCAHELAHQWFGDKVTCHSFTDIWLNEGFATQLASVFMEQQNPATALSNRRLEVSRITALPGGSVRVDDTNSISRIFDNRLSYLKGSHLLYMLRWKMGDSAFFLAARNYLADPALSYHYASTADLIRHLKAAGAKDIDAFFEQWYSGQGYPSYRLQWTQAGPGTVQIRLGQLSSHESVPFFALPVALKFSNASESKTVIVDHKTNGELFTRDIGFIADTVEIDPECWLISAGNTTERVDSLLAHPLPFEVYPNPAGDAFQVQISDMAGPYVYVQLCDLSGRLLFRQRRDLYNGKDFIRIPAETLASGSYILRITDGRNEVFSRQLLKR